MKRFIVSVLFVAVFFIGLGSLVEKAGAKFKSDEKALGIIAQARQAIGGDQNLAAVKGLSIVAKATKTFEIEGAARTEQGDLEINMQLPDKFSKMMKLGKHDGEGPGMVEKKIDVVVIADGSGEAKFKVNSDGGTPGEKNVLIRKVEGGNATIEGPDGAKADVVIVRKAGDGGAWTSENGEVHKIVAKGEAHGKGIGAGHGAHHQNEMLRTTLSLLLSAPEGLDVGYTYAGEESVDGSSCDVINVEATGSSFRLYLDKSSHLPKMISYQAAKPMVMMFRTKSDDAKPAADAKGEAHVFTRTVAAPEMAQYQVKFSDYRNVGGVQLPYRWAQTVGGKDDEVVDVTSYDVNPANIASKFQEQKVFVRTKKPDTPQ